MFNSANVLFLEPIETKPHQVTFEPPIIVVHTEDDDQILEEEEAEESTDDTVYSILNDIISQIEEEKV